NLTTGAFTSERLQVLQLLSSQAAISLENARLYTDLEDYNRTLAVKVKERTLELQEKNLHLQQEIRDRQQAEAAAEAASRAKSQFLTNMSHELRTPLNGILGYAQILQKAKTLTDQQVRGLDLIHQCGEHLLTLISDILDLSKIEAQKMELHPDDFSFPEFLESIAEICGIRAKQKGIELIYKPLGTIPKAIRADEKRLRQVLINLLSNAVKFTDKGSVTLKVGYHEEKLRFQVEDTGIGILPRELEEIFLPFQQVGDRSRGTEGTGLGLAISRQLVRMMGGELQVKSTLGQGSIFWLDLDLPEIAQGQAIVKGKQRPIIGFKGSKRKVLVVEDKWANRSIMVNLLEPLGFEVVEATDGVDGLNKAREFKPDIIFMDLVMPVMDGFEATRQLRLLPNLNSTVVIAISASVFDFNQQSSWKAGCDGFIPKPVREAELLEKLRVHLELEWIYEDPGSVGQLAPQQYGLQGSCFNEATPQNTLPPQVGESVPGVGSSALSTQPPSLVALPTQEIDILLDLAMRGDLGGIVERAAYLEQLDPQWVSFAAELRHLAEAFEEKQILELIINRRGLVNEQ
ncbi:MAG TPA: ATP-binding protein, partial [Candidatus Caenarcaniphilales bacterium]